VAAVCALTHPDHQGKFGVFAAIDDTRFTRIVRPGDVLDLECRITRLRGPIGKADATAHVGGELACRAGITFALTTVEAGA
jgi:3-hydroxyacyl-[acyl-carrier-protein] dehydratase